MYKLTPVNRESIQKISEGNWMMCPSGTVLPSFTNVPTTVNWTKIKRNYMNQPLHLFFSIFPYELWTKLATIVNKTFRLKLCKTDVGSSKQYMSLVSELDMIRWYGTVMALENMRSPIHDNIRSNYNYVKGAPFGVRRFEAITSALIPSNAELKEIACLISSASKKCVHIGSTIANDETVWGYQPSHSAKCQAEERMDPIPVAYIPGKPHPNGLMSWKFVAKFTNGEVYMTDIALYLNGEDALSPRQATLQMLEKWTEAHSPHLVLDARFSSIDFLRELSAMNMLVTMSVSPNHYTYIWSILRRGCELGSWSALVSNEGILASLKIQKNEKNEMQIHHLMTNAFFVQGWSKTSHAPISISEDADKNNVEYNKEDLQKMKIEKLAEIMRKSGMIVGKRKKGFDDRQNCQIL